MHVFARQDFCDELGCPFVHVTYFLDSFNFLLSPLFFYFYLTSIERYLIFLGPANQSPPKAGINNFKTHFASIRLFAHSLVLILLRILLILNSYQIGCS